jgi:hypothetical protein
MSELQPGDKRAAFIGLIVTAALLFLIAFSIVQITDASYAAEETPASTPH